MNFRLEQQPQYHVNTGDTVEPLYTLYQTDAVPEILVGTFKDRDNALKAAADFNVRGVSSEVIAL